MVEHCLYPHNTQQGRVIGVIVHATDVTLQVLARQQLVESKAALQNAIELAELGTWHVNCKTGATELSQRHADLFGLELTLLPFDVAFAVVHPDDHQRVRIAFEAAQQPGSAGHYQAEYRIINARTGQQRHIRGAG